MIMMRLHFRIIEVINSFRSSQMRNKLGAVAGQPSARAQPTCTPSMPRSPRTSPLNPSPITNLLDLPVATPNATPRPSKLIRTPFTLNNSTPSLKFSLPASSSPPTPSLLLSSPSLSLSSSSSVAASHFAVEPTTPSVPCGSAGGNGEIVSRRNSDGLERSAQKRSRHELLLYFTTMYILLLFLLLLLLLVLLLLLLLLISHGI
jgi:hypothetical protein